MSPDSSALTSEGTAAYRREVEEGASILRESISGPPAVGIVDDVGLDHLLREGTVDTAIPVTDLPHLSSSDGDVLIGTVGGTRVAALRQDWHLYDGYSPRTITFPVRMLVEAGVDTLLFPALAGSVNPQFARGDVMLVTDHVNLQGQNPLVGPNVDDWGPRFPDMTEPYAPRLRQLAADVARQDGLSLQKGVYLALLGPNPETTAEHRMVRRLGADAVGTSVVPEVIAARHMGADVLSVVLLAEKHLADDGRSSSDAKGGQGLEGAQSDLRRLLTGIVTRVGRNGTSG